MADPYTAARDGGAESSGMGDPGAALEQMQGLLRSKDDTARFVGLALMKSVLDNQPQLREDFVRLTALWEAISPKFLDRLLRAGQSQTVKREEAKDMVDIAVAVLHTFAILLPEDARDSKRLVGRTAALVNALIYSSPESTVLILQTLLTIVSQRLGALESMRLEDISPLTEMAPEQPLVLDILGLAWANASTEPSELPAVRGSINKIIPMLLSSFNRTDAVTFLAFIGDTLPKLPYEAIPDDPVWLQSLLVILQRLVTSRPTLTGRAAYTSAAASLLQAYPTLCPRLLFMEGKTLSSESKPFSYLFISLLLIDIRSSFPSLLCKLNNSEYPTISKRLACAFDVISSFIGFLVRALDDDNENSFNSASFNMSPDLLLKLRKDIAEIMSLTIEYLRDRWDASIAGAAGLHPLARTGTSTTSEGTRLTLTWESMQNNVTADSLILASIRTLAMWLREDENENLRNESAGLIDMLVELYQACSTEVLDFRYPILLALEAIMITDDGIDSFLAQNGWETLSKDLISVISCADAASPTTASEASRGIDIVRVMLAVLDHESTTEPLEEWMTLVTAAASMKHTTPIRHPLVAELQIAVLQLAAALLNLSSVGMQKRYVTSITAILGLAAQMQTEVKPLGGTLGQELHESLDDVAMILNNLR